ncbi:glycosyltransferase family 39 protein [Paludibaculum fermentans]|uniref:glycosyltransferase family 39 protein n=1 Tax=Paludibaculum fermentans TaxID=1473598 RepID=UPI003EBD314D
MRRGTDFLGFRARDLVSGPILPPVIFVALALLCLPYPGLQQDEVLFAWPLYRPAMRVFDIDIAGTHLPLMLMSYLGALKSWLYLPLLQLWAPSIYSLRVPAVLLAAVTIYLLHRLLSALHSRTAAAIAAYLLATDSIYILTSTFDWGPVVLQHLLLVSFLLCLHQFLQRRQRSILTLAFALAGLAFWDKAVAVWLAAGLALAALTFYPRLVRQYLNLGSILTAALAFSLGALPLLAYNATRAFSTITSNSAWELRGPLQKFPALLQTLNGSALFGALVNQEWQSKAIAPSSALETLVVTADRAGFSAPYSALPLLVLLSLLLLLLAACASIRRFAFFLILAFAVAWWFMASTHSAGGSPHHVALLWPLPHMLIGLVFAQAMAGGSRLRTPLLAVIILGLGLNAANTNRHAAGLMRFGAAWQWTDATSRLPGLVQTSQAGRIGVDDWGIAAPLDVVTKGQLDLLEAAALGFTGGPGLPRAQTAPVLQQVQETLWLGWTPEFAVQPAAKLAMQSFAAAHGLDKSVQFVVMNRNAQAMLEGYRFVPRAAGPPAPFNVTQPGAKPTVYDDPDSAIRFQGHWEHSRGFGQALLGTLAYTNAPGASAQFEFQGSSVTLVYTKAFNRGSARIRLDGKTIADLDYYDPAVQWQQQFRLDHLTPDRHTLTIEALGRSQPGSQGTFIDLDAILVEPGNSGQATAPPRPTPAPHR